MDNRKEFEQGIEKLIKNLQQAATRTVNALAETAVETAQNTDRFNNVKKQSTYFIPNGMSAIVGDDRSYAEYLEFGNNAGGPYIYPRNAKALRFKINGEIVFAKRVRSHGPYLFITNGRNYAETKIQEYFSKFMEEK